MTEIRTVRPYEVPIEPTDWFLVENARRLRGWGRSRKNDKTCRSITRGTGEKKGPGRNPFFISLFSEPGFAFSIRIHASARAANDNLGTL